MKIVIYLCLFLATLLTTGCTKKYAHPLLAKDAHILALGDSYTLGVGASTGYTYPAVLQNSIERKVINGGMANATTDTIARTLENYKLDPRVKVVVLLLGAVDLYHQSDMRYVRANLTRIITYFNSNNIPVILIGMAEQDSTQAHPMYQEIASRLPVIYNDNAFVKVLRSKSNIENESRMLNADGYRVLAENVEAILSEQGFIR